MKPPAPRTTAPPRRQTVEVQLAWLEPDPGDVTRASALERPSKLPIDVEAERLDPLLEPAASNESPRKRPPRLPGAAQTLPPMPIVSMTQRPPPRRHATLEVEMNWLELVEEKTRTTASNERASKSAPAEKASASNARPRKPIRREED